MSLFVLVLGINSDEYNMFGGVIDLEKAHANSMINEYADLLYEALQTTSNTPTIKMDGDVNCYDGYESIPFNGYIEREILVYAE